MQTLESVGAVADLVTYKDWIIHVGFLGDGFYIQCRWKDKDRETGEFVHLRGAKHYVSAHCTDDEIVKRCFVAVRDAEMHELLEEFKLNGVAPFNPHNDVFALASPDFPKVHRTQLNPIPVGGGS